MTNSVCLGKKRRRKASWDSEQQSITGCHEWHKKRVGKSCMLTSSGYLTCGLTMACVQSLDIQPLGKQGQRWLRLSLSGLPETYSKHAICLMKMDIWRQCDRRVVDLLGSRGSSSPHLDMTPGFPAQSTPNCSMSFEYDSVTLIFLWT